MIRPTVLLGALALTALSLLSASAHAQVFRAYLASDGNDANPCTLPSPCRLLPAALTAVADGGEIWMLDSANYNTAPVNITKSVTILAIPGAVGSVLATAGDAIVIATAGVKVALRNLAIVPLPGTGGAHGINMTAGIGLTLDNCLVAGAPSNGINVTGASLRITDSTIRDSGFHGVMVRSGARATLTRSTVSGNGNTGVYVIGEIPGTTTTADIGALTLDSNGATNLAAYSNNLTAVVKVSLRESLSARSGSGVTAQSDAGASITVSVSNSTIADNTVGMMNSSAASKMWASGNTVSNNNEGIVVLAGVVESAGDNAVRNNPAGDTFGPITVIATK